MARKKNENDPFIHQTEDRIITKNAEDILGDCFGRYSKEVIQNRALPDARDGLKPVQRRILYDMGISGNTYHKSYHKSARTVGSVLATLHPHGDTSVYDAMCRLSQDWKLNIPLVDMQGNNGSIDGDGPAAMRYTEARLSHLSDYLLKDINKDTVEWVPNFSDEELEPTVLPVRFPNLLTTGISGIASGYATNIPPHNLNEIMNAVIYKVKNPDATLEDLMQFVKGPDFPTGGIVMGIDGIKHALETGRGKVIVRGKAEVVKNQMIITEIPYEVVKSQLVKRIDELRIDKKLAGVLDVRDESGRDGLRIVLDMKKDAPVDSILNYLYKNTDLQVNINYNITAIVNKAPKQIGLVEALRVFIDHRVNVIKRRSIFEKKQKEAREHIVDGLIKAMDILDEIIKTIRSSNNKGDAKVQLVNKYDFSDKQAEAIVSMQLYRLTNTDVDALLAEQKQLKEDIAELNKILTDQNELNNVIIAESQEIIDQFKTPRKSKIQGMVEDIVIDEQAMIPSEQVMLSVTESGYIKKSSIRSFSASGEAYSPHKEGDIIIHQSENNTRNTLIIFTDQGHYVYMPIYKLKESKWKDLGEHLCGYFKVNENEKVVSVLVIESLQQSGCVYLATRNGMVKKVPLKTFEISRMNKLTTCMNIGKGDALLTAQYTEAKTAEIYFTTKSGKGLTYNGEVFSDSGLKTQGVKGIKLVEDELAGFSINPERITVADKYNQIKPIDLESYAKTAKGTQGKQIIKKGNEIDRVFTTEVIKSNKKEINVLELEPTKSTTGYLKKYKPEAEVVEYFV